MIAQATNWNAVIALAAVGGVLVSLLGIFVNRKANTIHAQVQDVSARITTPGDLPPIGQATADVLTTLKEHSDHDDERFAELHKHLGTLPQKAPAKAAAKKAAKRGMETR